MSAERNNSTKNDSVIGTGELAGVIRDFAWESNSLGPISTWSPELLSLVNVILASPLPMLLYWGKDLTLLYNDAARPIASTKHPEAIGSPADKVWQEAWHIIGPEVQSVLDSGKSISHQNVLVPLEQNGVLTDLYWNYSYSAAYEGGKVCGVLLVCADVTDATKDREALRSTADLLDNVLSATSDAIFSLDKDWKFTFINPRAYEVMQRDDVLGTMIWESFPATVYEGSPYTEHYHRAMYEKISGSFEAFYPEPLNVWLEVTAQPTLSGITVFFRDTTEEKKRERLLIRTEKLAAVGRMAASMSHEINNPLEAVTNLIYIARTEPDRAKTTAYLEDADRELRRVGNIVNQTLRFHRQSSNPTPMFFHDLVSSVLSMYESRLGNAKIHVSKRQRDSRTVDVYEGDIRQVLNNLVGNAIDAMPTGGQLLIRSREATDWRTERSGVVITIADSGIGMASEDQQHIFEAFFTTKGIGGSGLGLWVSSEIINRHQGRLRFRSSQKSGAHGTVFTVFLPFNGVPLPT